MILESDKKIVRELAKRYMELVTTDKQKRSRERARNTNDLIQVRPPVILDEIPWYQMDIDDELTLRCQNGWARNVERHFRRCLYYFKYFKADNNFEPFFRVKRAYDSTGIGIEMKAVDIKRTDENNNIVSSEFEDVLADESALELLHDPEFTLRPDEDENNMLFYSELLGDSIPIRLYGFDYYYDGPWDKITRLRGVEPILFDMYDRPDLRKIGCSPWAKVEVMAEKIGRNYVLARKPNPAFVAINTDPEVIRAETEETVKACIKYGCPYEFVLKDISTVSGKPQNLIVWAQTVSEVLDEYYGKE